jgi:hypothetical protein
MLTFFGRGVLFLKNINLLREVEEQEVLAWVVLLQEQRYLDLVMLEDLEVQVRRVVLVWLVQRVLLGRVT